MDVLCHCGAPLHLVDIDRVWKIYRAEFSRRDDGKLVATTDWDLQDEESIETIEEFIECANNHKITKFILKELTLGDIP
jgi:hypothetical protein